MTELDPGRCALVLFDFLEGHVNRDGESKRRYASVVANAALVLAAARKSGVMVVYANADHRADAATTFRTVRDTDNRLRPIAPEDEQSHRPLITGGTPEARVVPALASHPDEFIVPKHRWSAFHGTYLETALRARRIHTLLLTGGSTDVGIASTAFAARDLGYNLVIVSDACTSPEEDNHDQLMRRVFPRMARVRTAREVVSMLGA
jgi:nicotinamidase-related amidase